MKKLFVLIVIPLLISCSGSKITSSWRTENFQPKKYSKIMILGLIREKDRSIREKMEMHFVGDLTDRGYNAISSLAVFGPKAFRRMSEDSSFNLIETQGADAVITIVLLDKSKEERFVPGNITPQFYYNRFGAYYTTTLDRIINPGYYVTDTKYFWESNFYDMQTRQLIYSVQTQSFSPSSSEVLGHQYGKMIVKDMVQKHVL